MALIEAVLMYCPVGLGCETQVPLCATWDRSVLYVVRDQLLKQAREEAAMWKDLDPGIAAMKVAEVDRLRHILQVILPDDPLPDLRRVK